MPWERILRAGEKPSNLVMVAGEDGDPFIIFASDDYAQVAVYPGFIIGFPELFVEKTRGVLLCRGEMAIARVVRLERLDDPPDGPLLLCAEPLSGCAGRRAGSRESGATS